MDEAEIVKVVKRIYPVVTIERDENIGGDLHVKLNGKSIVTIHYLYGWIDNASQYTLADQIAHMFSPPSADKQ